MTDHGDFGVREGEIAATLPTRFDAGLWFIGRCRTPWTRRDQCPKSGADSAVECALEIDALWAPGLERIGERAHLWALYFMDRGPRHVLVQRPRHSGERRGVFALRSPARPNPIALSLVRLLRVEPARFGATRLVVTGLDCLDGTPLIDLKPDRTLFKPIAPPQKGDFETGQVQMCKKIDD